MILLILSLVDYSGNIGARSELNVADNDNLPPAYASLYFNFRTRAGPVGFTLNGEFSQSEKRFSPQLIKRLGFSSDIGLLHLDIGDHSPRYSKYTLSGTELRGLSFRLVPGPFILGMTGGRIRVGGADTLGEYRREVYSLITGVQTRSFEFTANIARLNDRSSEIDSIYTPQENIAAGLSGKIVLPMRIKIEGEGGYSVHTMDKRAEVLDTLSFHGIKPADFGFTPRISTRMDFGYSYSVLVPLNFISLRYGRDYIGPGFATLGNPYLKNDVKKDFFSASLNLFRGKFFGSFTYLTQADNLSGEKSGTTEMDNFAYSVAIRSSKYFNIKGRFSNLTREKSDSVYPHTYTGYSYEVSPEVKFEKGKTLNTVYFRFTFNNSELDTIVTQGKVLGAGYKGDFNGNFNVHSSIQINELEGERRTKFDLGLRKPLGEKNSVSASIGFGSRFESRLSGYFIVPGGINIQPDFSYYRTTSNNIRFSLNVVKSF